MKNCFLLFVFFASLTVGTCLRSQVPADLEMLLSQTLDSMRNVLNAKSLSAAMQFPDGEVWAHAKGISSTNPPVNVTIEDSYLIGSVTKTITAACILQLHDEGVLSIDDNLHEWLDTMPFINPDITIRQLLQHTSGIHDVLSTPGQQDSLLADISKIWTPEELIEKFIRPPLFQPGAMWSYSNTNYFLLGMIIKKATGNPFYTEIRNRFYGPLALNSFAIPAFEQLDAPVAHVWLDITGDNVLDDAHDFYTAYLALNSTAGAAGGYYSTPTDCTKWMRTYMRGDLLSAETMAAAKTLVTAQGSQGGKYGLGLMKNNFLGNLAYGHGGDLAYHASSWYFPEKDISITVFTNDSSKDSWKLLPVVTELLRTCVNYSAVSPSSIINNMAIQFEAFPNPFKDGFKASFSLSAFDGDMVMTLTNTMGQELKSIKIKGNENRQPTFDFEGLESLVPGVYFLTTTLDGVTSKTLKVLKSFN